MRKMQRLVLCKLKRVGAGVFGYQLLPLIFLLLLSFLFTGCNTIEITTPSGYSYKSKQPAFSTKVIKSVTLSHNDAGDITFNLEGYNSDMATGYVEAVKIMSDALVKATTPLP